MCRCWLSSLSVVCLLFLTTHGLKSRGLLVYSADHFYSKAVRTPTKLRAVHLLIIERARKVWLWCSRGTEGFLHASDDVAILGGEVSGFTGVAVKMIEFPRARLLAVDVLTDAFPGSVADGDLASVASEFPDHGFVAFESAVVA